MTVLNRSRSEALVRRHFSFALGGESPTISRSSDTWRAAFPVEADGVELLCDVDRDFLETVVVADEQLPIASQHTGQGWTDERLERAFAEQAADRRRWLA
jgi:hypothetical protein